MLRDDFYVIRSDTREPGMLVAGITINKDHRIFDGHFPGQPVVPGACLFQIIREMTEMTLGVSVQLLKADQLKFLVAVDPNDTSPLDIELKYVLTGAGSVQVAASIKKNNTPCFKFSGLFRLDANPDPQLKQA